MKYLVYFTRISGTLLLLFVVIGLPTGFDLFLLIPFFLVPAAGLAVLSLMAALIKSISTRQIEWIGPVAVAIAAGVYLAFYLYVLHTGVWRTDGTGYRKMANPKASTVTYRPEWKT